MARHEHAGPPVFELPAGAGALRTRIAESVLLRIRSGALVAGDPMPSTRRLATELGVGRASVVAAYEELIAAGHLVASGGSGTHVGPGAGRVAAAGDRADDRGADRPDGSAPSRRGHRNSEPSPSSGPVVSMRPGIPDSALIDAADWRRAWRAAAARPVTNTYPFGDGHPELASALVDHLRRYRGMSVDAQDIVVVPGVAAAVSALAVAAGWGGRTVAVEHPGHLAVRMALKRAGAALSPTPVDGSGLVVDALARDVDGVYVTPSHQYPLGGRMDAGRRRALLDWARIHDAVVVEDDYDSEYRFDVAPEPAVHAEPGARDHVAFFGTASKVLTPALRCAWLIPPPHLYDAVVEETRRQYLCVDRMATLALAHFLESGAWGRHVARSTRTYADRRAALVRGLHTALPEHEVVGVDAGLHVVLRLPDGCDDVAVVSRLARAGLEVPALSSFAAVEPAPGADVPRGLALSYATLPATRAATVAGQVADAVAAVLGGRA